MEDYGNYVEILGEKFPACNIQIYDCYPELKLIPVDEDALWFGVYFEILFESGTSLTVTQEAAEEANGLCQTLCKENPNFLNHFLVEEYRHQMSMPSYAWHCSGEEELLSVLQATKRNLASSFFPSVA